MGNWLVRPWRQAFVFRGRATRRECCGLYLQIFLLFLILLFISGALAGAPPDGAVSLTLNIVWLLFYVGTFVVTLTAYVRRLHDQDKPGWIYLLTLVPMLGFVFLLVFLLTPGTLGANRYGPNPREGSAGSTRELEQVFS